MTITDPLADMFTVIRNAARTKKAMVEFPASTVRLSVLEVLKTEGYIKNFKSIKDEKQGLIRVYFRFTKHKLPTLNNIKRISKPGLRVYAAKDKIPRVMRGMGTAIISTSSGVMTDQKARQLGVGGEVICQVW
ncbi:30S ribosomal protein S8 [Candidatus Omnitrophota bacterium]